VQLSRDTSGYITAPGLIDIHVHFREPGFEYKEDILSGSLAAAAGGFTTCCCMPNTSPVADNAETVNYITEKSKKAVIEVLPIAAVTIGQQGEQLTNFASLKKAGAVALSDDGIPIKDEKIMRAALISAKENDMLIISHCEDEEEMAARDVKLAAELGARIHIAHISTAETVDIIRRAKAAGVKVTAETAPHYFSLTSEEVSKQGANACMNPPLRTQSDVEAIIEGLCDGTIDVIATDHAPHSISEKALPVGKAPNGIIGLETSLAVTLTYLYHTGILSLERIIELMSVNPGKILGLDKSESVAADFSILGAPATVTEQPKIEKGVVTLSDYIIFYPDEEWIVDPSTFKSKSRNTPFAGMKLRGKVKQTVVGGKVVYEGERKY